MATSGSYSFSVTQADIINTSAQILGKLGEGEVLSASDFQMLSRILNMIVKQLQGKADKSAGLKMWTRRRGHLFLSSTTGGYLVGPGAKGWTNSVPGSGSPWQPALTGSVAGGGSVITLSSATGLQVGSNIGIELDSGDMFWTTISLLSPITLATVMPSAASSGNIAFHYVTTAQQPIVIETAVLRDIFNNDVPLKLMTTQTYDFLPSKTNPDFVSDPTAIYYEFQLTNGYLFTDVAGAQDVTKHLVITYMEAIQDMINPLDTPEYPQEWYLALAWKLARSSHSIFTVPWSQSMEAEYQEATAIAKSKDPERSEIFFQPGEDGSS